MGIRLQMKNTDLMLKNLIVHLSTTPGALKINLQQKQQKQRKLQGFSNVSQTCPKKKNRRLCNNLEKGIRAETSIEWYRQKSVLGFQIASVHLQSSVFLSNKDKYIRGAVSLELISIYNTNICCRPMDRGCTRSYRRQDYAR